MNPFDELLDTSENAPSKKELVEVFKTLLNQYGDVNLPKFITTTLNFLENLPPNEADESTGEEPYSGSLNDVSTASPRRSPKRRPHKKCKPRKR